MTKIARKPEAPDILTTVEGYDSMRVFLEGFVARTGSASEDLAFLIGGLKWVDGAPADPDLWQRWIESVRVARGAGGTGQAGG
jgi:hypothetical protein